MTDGRKGGLGVEEEEGKNHARNDRQEIQVDNNIERKEENFKGEERGKKK